MTHDNRYELAACGASSQKGLTLYEARKELLKARDLGHLGDASHIRRSGRCVGYYNLWTETVRPMYRSDGQGALRFERVGRRPSKNMGYPTNPHPIEDIMREPLGTFGRRLAAELSSAWRHTSTTIVVNVSEALSAEVSQRLDGDITVGLSGLSNEYRHFNGSPGGVIIAASFIREALAQGRTA